MQTTWRSLVREKPNSWVRFCLSSKHNSQLACAKTKAPDRPRARAKEPFSISIRHPQLCAAAAAAPIQLTAHAALHIETDLILVKASKLLGKINMTDLKTDLLSSK
jgi:hypothetical protein